MRRERAVTTRRALAALGLVAVLAAGTINTSSGAEAQVGDTRPNFVVILVDDLDQRTSPLWSALTRTRSLLRDRGVTFSNHFAPTPICCPARGTILTGRYGHNTGVLTNGGDDGGWATFAANGNEQRTFARYLQNAGYRTGLAGKYLNGIEDQPGHIPPGWTEWYGGIDRQLYRGYGYSLNENGRTVSYGSGASDYLTDVLAQKSADFIDGAGRDGRPFLWYVAPTAPHLPHPPAPRHANHPYVNATVPRLPNYLEDDISDKPNWLRITGPIRSAEVRRTNEADYRRRMGSLYAIDDLVARIVDTLAARGELNNTFIVFTSDNGYNLGAHRLIQKMAPYEESIRVPLVIAGPGMTGGRTESRMTLHNDLMPTLLELAGVAVPSDVDGRSLAPLLRGSQPSSWRTDFIAQYASNALGTEDFGDILTDVIDVPKYRALRTTRYLYVEWYDYEDPRQNHEYELYDLQTDPYQLTNLLATRQGRQQHRDLTNSLAARLNQLNECSGASCR